MAEFRRELRYTSPMIRGKDVKTLQGRIGAVPDGIFGPKTERTLKVMERNLGLTPDGVVTRRDWQAIARATTGGDTAAPARKSNLPKKRDPLESVLEFTKYAGPISIGIILTLLGYQAVKGDD